MFKAWWTIGMLAVESQQVMWLRFMRLAAGGPTASAEAQRMVSEKLAIAAPSARAEPQPSVLQKTGYRGPRGCRHPDGRPACQNGGAFPQESSRQPPPP